MSDRPPTSCVPEVVCVVLIVVILAAWVAVVNGAPAPAYRPPPVQPAGSPVGAWRMTWGDCHGYRAELLGCGTYRSTSPGGTVWDGTWALAGNRLIIVEWTGSPNGRRQENVITLRPLLPGERGFRGSLNGSDGGFALSPWR